MSANLRISERRPAAHAAQLATTTGTSEARP